MTVINDNVSRRRFLSSAFMSLGVGLGLGTLFVRFGQFLIPTPKPKKSEEILIARVSDIPEKAPLPIEVSGNKALLLKTEDGFAAFSRKCTDLGCLVSWDASREQFVCPCHQGVYDRNGKNIAGPPPRPLDRFEVVKKGEMLYVKVTV
jgi:cytochrome b6-f complex iron-sulfur subunit